MDIQALWGVGVVNETGVGGGDAFVSVATVDSIAILLLAFFVLASAFMGGRPMRMAAPTSISRVGVPRDGVLSVLISPSKGVFVDLSGRSSVERILRGVKGRCKMAFAPRRRRGFTVSSAFNMPVGDVGAFLSLPASRRSTMLGGRKVPYSDVSGRFGT